MAISTYLSIIYLNVNEINASIKRHRTVDCLKKKNKTHLYDAYKRFTSQLKRHTDGEGMEKDISCKWK